MAWFNQVELTLVIQSSMSVWTDKRVYLRRISGSTEDRQALCLPKRPNGRCGLLWGLCKHPRLLALKEGLAHLYGYQISGLKQRAAGKPEILGRKKRVPGIIAKNEQKREDLKEDTKYNGLRILWIQECSWGGWTMEGFITQTGKA